MRSSALVGVLGLAIVAVAGADGVVLGQAQAPPAPVFVGACYCRAPGVLQCTADLTEQQCQQRCDEALFDDWIWKERLPCWNWGYGG